MVYSMGTSTLKFLCYTYKYYPMLLARVYKLLATYKLGLCCHNIRGTNEKREESQKFYLWRIQVLIPVPLAC